MDIMKNNLKKKFGLIDCTIRDGGNYNDWNFSQTDIKNIISSLDKSSVQYIEVGYFGGSGSAKGSEYGSPFFCREDYVNKLPRLSSASYAFMVVPEGNDKYILTAPPRQDASLLRIATYPQNLSSSLPVVEQAHKLGWKVSLNIMSISRCSDSDLKNIAIMANELPVSILYAADSYGHLLPNKVERLANIFQEYTDENISLGFHGHNNLGLAFANALVAVNNGFSMIDGSLCGLARGAGNLPLETVSAYLHLSGDLSKPSLKETLKASEYVSSNILSGCQMPLSSREIICGICNEHYHKSNELINSW